MKPTLLVLSPFASIVEFVSTNGGWTTVKFDDGKEQKVRNGQLRPATPEEIAAHKPFKAAKTPRPELKAPPAKEPKKRIKMPETGDAMEGDGRDDETNAHKTVDPDYTRYTKHDVKSPSGRKALDISDAAADLLRGQDISDCYFIVAKHIAAASGGKRANDVDVIEKELTAKYQHLNIGMQRMNLGNRLRKLMGIYGHLNAHKNTKPSAPKAVKPTKSGN